MQGVLPIPSRANSSEINEKRHEKMVEGMEIDSQIRNDPDDEGT